MLRLVIILLSLLWVAPCFAAYTMPIGVPDPVSSWGGTQDPIDDLPPARPGDWSSEVAGYYYINPQTGTTQTWGTPASPRATFPTAPGAGSYIEAHGNYTGVLTINCGGTSAAWSANSAGPVWIVGYEGEEPTFQNQVVLRGSYCYVDNVNTGANGANTGRIQTSTQTDAVAYVADHMVIRNSNIVGNTAEGAYADGGISINGSTVGNSNSSYILVYNNTIHDIGLATCDNTADPEPACSDAHAVFVTSYASNVWILSNSIHDARGAGVSVTATETTIATAHHIYVGKNTVYNTWQAGLAIKYGQHVIFSQNTVHDIVDCTWSMGKGIGAQYDPRDYWVIFNHIYNVTRGVHFASLDSGATGPLFVVGNVIHDCNWAEFGGNYDVTYDSSTGYTTGGITLWDIRNTRVVGNTIYDADTGISTVSTNAALNCSIENNIISTRSQSLGREIYIAGGANYQVHKNVFYSPLGNRFKYGSGDYTTVAALQTAMGANATGNISDNPLLLNPPTNMSINSGSPAKETGLPAASLQVDVYALFLATYGLSIQYDYAGTSRPVGEWDMGAYEFFGFSDTLIFGIKTFTQPNLRGARFGASVQ